jgi:serine-type D-Ala-D-Ala carboxypeptidase
MEFDQKSGCQMKHVAEMMENGVRKGVFPGAVLLVSGGDEVKYSRAFGVSDVFTKKPMMINSIFDLASLTKPLSTAMAVFKLIELKKMSLDQKLSSIMPDTFSKDKSEVTIRQLLNHTSGLPAHKEYFVEVMNCKKTFRREKLRHLILNEPLENKPGENQTYSDLGYILLAWMVEKIAGERIDRFVDGHIYKPLGIEDCFFIDLFSSGFVSDNQKERVVPTENCSWRKKTLKAEVHDDNAWAAGGFEGHAGLFGDALSVWTVLMEMMNALQGKKTIVLDSHLISEIMKKESNSEFRAGFDTPSQYGSSSGDFFSKQSIGHLGYTGTSFWIDPERSIIIILLTNRVHPRRDNEKLKLFRPKIHNLIMEQVF